MNEQDLKKLSRDEVYKATLNYFNGDALATTVWIDKYALKDSEGNIYELTPDDMHKRLSKEFARIENKYINPIIEEKIYELLKDFKYIVPQGGPMAGIGNNFVITSLSNCFVIDSPTDSYGGIMKSDEEQVQLMKRRGGVGHDLSSIRPTGMLANGTKLKGDAGMTLFMNRYSNSTREVAQDGRRGALMLSTSIKHPDAEKFIDMKVDTSKITGANVSVRVDDLFMNSVKNKSNYIQQFPIDSDTPKLVSTIDANKLWSKIIHNAWKSAEPGILFWDTILKECPTAGYPEEWRPVSTNPCGEIPLCPYDSCRLIAINLFAYVINPFTSKACFNFSKFKEDVKLAQRFMDDLVDLEIEKIDAIISKIMADPEPMDIKYVELALWQKIKEKAINGRRTGLGTTGEGDMLAALGLLYGTKEATTFSTSIHKDLAIFAYMSSIELAKERGSFPIWDGENDRVSTFLNRIYPNLPVEYQLDWKLYGRRNIGVLTIAPTGTTSLMTQTTSGIEPVFAPVYKRRKKTDDKSKSTFIDAQGDMWEEFLVFHSGFLQWIKETDTVDIFQYLGFKKIEDLSVEDLPIIEQLVNLSPYKANAGNIDYLEKVRMQGEIQKWVDHSISVTVNMPETVTEDIVAQVYMLAWESGCKGITIYRDKCRDGVINNISDSKQDDIKYIDAPKRPKTLKVDIYTKKALGKDWTVIVGLLNNKPFEIFAFPQLHNSIFPTTIASGTLTKLGKQKYELKGIEGDIEYTVRNIIEYMDSEEQYQTRDFSRGLRHGEHPKFIISDIDKSSFITSFRKVISRVLKNYLTSEDVAGNCPNCGEELRFESGCKTCVNPECGWSACG